MENPEKYTQIYQIILTKLQMQFNERKMAFLTNNAAKGGHPQVKQ